MSQKKILYISQEIYPYLDETPISNTSRFLPQAIQDKGREIRAFMPKYGNINERRNQLHEVIRLSGMNLIIDDSDHSLIIKVASIQAARMQVYFIDNEDFFQNRETLIDKNGVEYDDNDERSIFFVRGVMETTALGARCNSLPRLVYRLGTTIHQAWLCRRPMFQECEGDIFPFR
jgi:starch synthase